MNIKELSKQAILFLGVGILGTALDYGCFVLLSFINVQYLLATVIGNINGAILNYLLNKKFTFNNTTNNLKKQLLKYSLSLLIYIGGTFFLMYIAVDYFSFNKYISRFVIIAIMFVINFLINKFIVFKENENSK